MSSPATAGRVGVAGPAAAALGEEDDRQPHALGELEHAVLLAVVLQALRAGEHGVVVRHARRSARARRRTASPLTRPMPATRPSAGVRAISSSQRAAAALRGDRERAVLDERARVAEVVDVLARGALARRAPARDRVGPRRVERERRAGASTSARSGRIASRSTPPPRRRTPSRRRRRPRRGPAGCPSKTVSPTATATWRTTPPTGASMTCSIFIASITSSRLAGVHRRRPRRRRC